MAERALNSLSVADYDQSKSSPSITGAEGEQIDIIVQNVSPNDFETVLRGLLDILVTSEYESLSVNALGDKIEMTFTSKVSRQVIADRILLGATPTIDSQSGTIKCDLADQNAIDKSPAEIENPDSEDEILKLLVSLEAKNWLNNPDKARKRLLQIGPQPDTPDDVRRRVAKVLFDALSDKSASPFLEEDVIKSLPDWHVEVTRESLSILILNCEWHVRPKLLEALEKVADESVVEPVATALTTDDSGHTHEPATRILKKFPELAEPILIKKMLEGEFTDSMQLSWTIEALASFGGSATEEAFQSLALRDLKPYVRKDLKKGIDEVQRRINNDIK